MNVHCNTVRDALPLFVYDNLEPGEMGRLGIHIGGCEDCLAEYRAHRELLDLVDSHAPAVANVDLDKLWERVEAPAAGVRWWLSGIALLLLVPLGLLLTSHSTTPIVEPLDEDPAIEPPILGPPESPRSPEPTPPAAPPPVDLARARQLLRIGAPAREMAELRELRQRIRATGVRLESFLEEQLQSGSTVVARSSLQLMTAGRPSEALEGAAFALRERDDLSEPALAILRQSSSPRAITLLEECWGAAEEPRIVEAIAAKQSRAAALALERRLRSLEADDGAHREALWQGLASLGVMAAESLAESYDDLPPELRPRAFALIVKQETRAGTRLLRSMLADEATSHVAACALAAWGDSVALPVLVRAAPESSDARRAMGQLASAEPTLVSEVVRLATARDDPLEAEQLAVAMEMWSAVAPEQVVRLTSRLAADRSQRELALKVASAGATPAAARALLPLGRDRSVAGRAVSVAARLGEPGLPTLFAFLSTRYGAAPAREALVAHFGVDLGVDPARWRRHLQRVAHTTAALSVPPSEH